MGSNIEYRFDGSVTEPAVVTAIRIPMVNNQYAQIKAFATCGDQIGDAGSGGFADYYAFAKAYCEAGAISIDNFYDIITDGYTTGILELSATGQVAKVNIYCPFGAGKTAKWALRVSVDYVDNVFRILT